ncbi:MAG: type II toxin-antitoxin system VapC family toxin [Armatimonadetes bacterium]|nr:type II toxin-antitoxin system VapC family toxin [Armatimonadota bacterium]
MSTSRILDTTTVSLLMKGQPHAVSRLQGCRRADVFIPQPVIAEIAYGLARLPESKRKERLEARFKLMMSQMHRADWTDDVSIRFGAVKALLERRGLRLEDFDLAIAAHALASEAILVTSNIRHMRRIPELEVESWEA